MGTGDVFNPSTWVSTLLGSQTGRTIVAEALVAAAAAAAGVLVASRTEAGQKAGRAIVSAGKRGGALAKEAALSAASAAADVITETATEALHTASKSLLTGALRDDSVDEPDMAETARRQRERRAH
jgi:putative copper export protein